MLKVSESWLELPDGDQLYTKSWTCQSPIATVLFIHGFGEHCSRYQHIFQMFSKDGISVFSYDQRGFGKTGIANNNLGYTGGMDLVLSDIKDAISRAKVPNKKLFLMVQIF